MKAQEAQRQGTQPTNRDETEAQRKLSGGSVTRNDPGVIKVEKIQNQKAKPSRYAHITWHILQRRNQGSGMRDKTVEGKQSWLMKGLINYTELKPCVGVNGEPVKGLSREQSKLQKILSPFMYTHTL